jgi:hypothetical protein
MFKMYIQSVAARGTVEAFSELSVGIDQNTETVGVTIQSCDLDEADLKFSFRMSIAETKILASLLSTVSGLVQASEQELGE